MYKLTAFLTSTYLLTFSPAVAAEEEVYLHGDIAHEIKDGIIEAEHAEKGGLPQFDPEWFASQLFWLAISFGILYFIFAKKTLPDISGVIENRKNLIESDLETAEKLTAEADVVHDAYQEGLTKAQGDAAQAIQNVDAEMKVKAAEALEGFRARSEEELAAAEGRIDASKIAMMDDMNSIVAETASLAVEKIIGQTDQNKVKAIVEGMNGKAKAA